MTVPVRRAAVIMNPSSGAGGYKRDLPLMIASMRDMGLDVVELPTENPGDATRLAREAVAGGFDVVVAIGGDGTVNEAVNGVAGSEVPLAIIPTGTVNVLALELGIPLDPPDACRLLSEGTVSWIDLGLAGERYFALMAGIGMDAAVVAGMNPILKRTLKEAAFFVQGVATLLTKEEPLLIVETPDRRVEGYFIVIGNSSNYGGAFGITPLADMRDGLLDVCVLKDRSFLTTAWYWLAALTNSHVKHPAVEYFRTETACIAVADGESEVLVQTDGEVAGHLPIDCRIAPRALRVIVP
jgi:YegS/Rv2252/BmrU family lipid kinase